MALMGVLRLELEMKVIVQVMVGCCYLLFTTSLLMLSFVHNLTQRPSKCTFFMIMHIYLLVLLVIL